MGKLLSRISESLILHARQSAWLDAPPTPPKNSKAKNEPTRRERYEMAGNDPPMPELDEAAYLWGFLGSVGITEPGPHGPVPMAWTSLEGWQRCNGLRLRPWEARALRGASAAFVSEWHAAQDPMRPAPWISSEPAAREHVANKIGSIFGALAKQKK